MTGLSGPLPERVEVAVVGGGPAGLATAMHLARLAPELLGGLVVLEAAHHPRRKICGGAVTAHAEDQLAALGVRADVDSPSVDRVLFRYGGHTIRTDQRAAMRVVQRADFDAALAAAAAARGVRVAGGVRLTSMRRAPDGYELQAGGQTVRARVVVGADGANSVVRRELGMRGPHGVARLLRAMAPADPAGAPAALFDFSCLADGVQGYFWAFPCRVDGRPAQNCGVFDCRIAEGPRGDLRATLFAALRARGVEPSDVRLEGHPVRWFEPAAPLSAPHALLVGDAAGVDPVFAEGISYAMEYGALAARAVAEAFRTGDLSFSGYRASVLASPLGRMLVRKGRLARLLYGSPRGRLWDSAWRLSAAAPAWASRLVGRSLGVLPAR